MGHHFDLLFLISFLQELIRWTFWCFFFNKIESDSLNYWSIGGLARLLMHGIWSLGGLIPVRLHSVSRGLRASSLPEPEDYPDSLEPDPHLIKGSLTKVFLSILDIQRSSGLFGLAQINLFFFFCPNSFF
jgi:hypothetical protein